MAKGSTRDPNVHGLPMDCIALAGAGGMGDPRGLLSLDLGGQMGCDPATLAGSPTGVAVARWVLTSGGRWEDYRGRSHRCHLCSATSGFSLSWLKGERGTCYSAEGDRLGFPG